MPDIEDQIRRAQEEGAFKDLPGKGKPLRLNDNPHEDPEWRMANHILHSSGFSLPWIEALRAIEADLEDARAAVKKSWSWRTAALAQGESPDQVQTEWQRAESVFRDQIERLNQRIADYNLAVPAMRFQRRKLNAEKELGALKQDVEGG
jgi:DnaJ family protein C protein 28